MTSISVKIAQRHQTKVNACFVSVRELLGRCMPNHQSPACEPLNDTAKSAVIMEHFRL